MSRRILMATDFYPPFIGGLERQVQLLGRELVRRGHRVDVATVWHRGLPTEQDDDGVQVHRLKALATRVPWFSANPLRRYHPPFPDPWMAWRLRQLINDVRPELVHAQGWIAYSCAIALLGKNIPLLISVRDHGYTCAIKAMLYRGRECEGPALLKCLGCAGVRYGPPKAVAAVAGVFAGRVLLRRKISGSHSISSYMQAVTRRDLLGIRLAGKASRTSLVPDFVIPSFLEPAKTDRAAASKWLPTEPYILFVGALEAHKGLPQLLEAYQRLSNPPTLLVIGTRWPDSPKVFPPGVIVRENVPHASVMAAWSRCLFAVVPSLLPEPLGTVNLEAMSQGKAVIASATGGIPDMVLDGVTGILVPPGDVEALAAAMQRLIRDAPLRERLGRAGRKRVRLFMGDSVVPRFEQLYEEFLGEPEASSLALGGRQ